MTEKVSLFFFSFLTSGPPPPPSPENMCQKCWGHMLIKSTFFLKNQKYLEFFVSFYGGGGRGIGQKNKKPCFSLIYIINYHGNTYKHISLGTNTIFSCSKKRNIFLAKIHMNNNLPCIYIYM